MNLIIGTGMPVSAEVLFSDTGLKNDLKSIYVRKNGIETLIWLACKYIYQNGTLADGTTYQHFTNTDGCFYSCADVGSDDSTTTYALVSFDFTGYDYVDITLDYQTYAFFGDAHIFYGFDGYTPTQLTDSNDRVSTTITLDISSYTGVHSIDFKLQATSDSDTYGATSSIWIKEIRLYNASGSSTTHTHTDACFRVKDTISCTTIEGYCSECGGYYTDHYWSCSDCDWTYHSRTSNCTCGTTPEIPYEDHAHKELICEYK